MTKAMGQFLNIFMVFSRIPVSFVFDIFTNEPISRNVYFFAPWSDALYHGCLELKL